MFKIIINNIKTFLQNWEAWERAMTQIRCLVSDRNSIIEKEILKFPINKQKYTIYKAYKLAYWGYSLNFIINELIFLRDKNVR